MSDLIASSSSSPDTYDLTRIMDPEVQDSIIVSNEPLGEHEPSSTEEIEPTLETI